MLSLPQYRATTAAVNRNASDLPLWFNSATRSPVVPGDLTRYISGEHYLSTKQVPSALLLSTAGSQSVIKNRDALLKAGFSLREDERGGKGVSRVLTAQTIAGGNPAPSGSLQSYLVRSSELIDLMNSHEDNIDTESDSSGIPLSNHTEVLEKDTQYEGIRFRKDCRYRMQYENPWKIHAGFAMATSMGYKPPEITVWSGDGIRLNDPLPSYLLGENWDGSRKNRIRFFEIADHQVKLELMYRHTHWGKALAKLCKGPRGEDITTWANILRSRINAFIGGRHDPLWTKRQRDCLLVKPDNRRSTKARSLRFIELLKTVDGVFTQRYLVYPEEVWTWQRFDTFTLGNISLLIGDEFLDGELRNDALSIVTSYTKLKQARKWYKMHSHRGDLIQASTELPEGNPWARQFCSAWKRSTNCEGTRRLYNIGVLSQTRGCGTPPPLVVLQSKVKFLTTISTERPKENPTMQGLRRLAVTEFLNRIPDEACTGLASKARVTVTTSACWEKTRKEGGTTEQVRILLESVDPMEEVPIRDLDTGQIQSYRSSERFASIGELIFWISLDHVLRTPLSELRKAFLTVVKEPGKARSVTKARACLKIVLDFVSKICSEPLLKGVRSSTSGMGAAHHGWNFFQLLSSNEMKDDVFHILEREEHPYASYLEVQDTYENLYVLSTDYQEATDRMLHNVAADLGDPWMIKCGIPGILRGIVNATCYYPRTIYFEATGPLVDMGIAAPEYGSRVRCIPLFQGVLMGDPLTKPVLHILNVLTRTLGSKIFDPAFYRSQENSAELSYAIEERVRYYASRPP